MFETKTNSIFIMLGFRHQRVIQMKVPSNQSDRCFGDWQKGLEYRYRFRVVINEMLTETVKGEKNISDRYGKIKAEE